MLGVRWWFIALSGLGAILGLRKKNRTLVIITLLWIAFLVLEGNAYMFNIPILTFTNAQEVIIMMYIPASILIGILMDEIAIFSQKYSIKWAEPVLIWLLMFSGFIGSYYRIFGIEDGRFFMTNQDRQAMEWIKVNSPKDAVFAIQTHYWLINSQHGSDAGYWIPYFSNRQTTSDTMLASLGPGYDIVMERSNAVKSLYNAAPTIDELCNLGVDYIYDGAKEPFEGLEFDVDKLVMLSDVKLIYESGGVSILKICD